MTKIDCYQDQNGDVILCLDKYKINLDRVKEEKWSEDGPCLESTTPPSWSFHLISEHGPEIESALVDAGLIVEGIDDLGDGMMAVYGHACDVLAKRLADRAGIHTVPA